MKRGRGPVVVSSDLHGLVESEVGRALVAVSLEEKTLAARVAEKTGPQTWLAADTSGNDGETLHGLEILDTSRGLAEVLAQAADRAGDTGTFVSADRVQRHMARKAGWITLPSLSSDSTQRFILIRGDLDPADLPGFVPYSIDRIDSGTEVIGSGDEMTIAAAVGSRCDVQLLAGDPIVDDLVRVHLDVFDRHTVETLHARRVLHHRHSAGIGVVFIALGPDEFVEDIGIHGAHGHTMMLSPRPELLESPAPLDDFSTSIREIPRELVELIPKPGIDLSQILSWWCSPDSNSFQNDVDRYSGAQHLDASGAISSRHVDHPDNGRVVSALLKDLRDIGYCAWTHSFTYEGRTVRNVLAELPGRGYLVLKPDIEARLRDLVLATPRPDRQWCKRVIETLPTETDTELKLNRLEPLELRHRLIEILDLKLWWPWWCLRPAAGWGAQLVLVGCHLDSTAASDGGFDPTTDAAPGADDDASGVAAVLAAARRLWRFRGSLTHTVRFAFFNAEEVGLVGSGAYASMLKTSNAPVKAVVCADMIGYNSDALQIFEIHAGSTNPAVRDLSVPIAEKVAGVASAQGILGDGQIYKGTSWPPAGSANRDLYDGAINRSDHASFHSQGYGAVVVSEDFFANLSSEPARDANPNYHRGADQTVDPVYGARIACAISEAVRQLAN